MFPIACYQATGQHYAHSALNDRFPAILNAQNPAIPSAHPQELDWMDSDAMNTENMSCFLALVSKAHPNDHRILMVVDGASSHKTIKLVVPENMTLLGMPPYSPELNPVEHLWDYVG